MEWFILILVLLFGLVFGATSPQVKTRFKMHQSRVTKNNVLEDYDAERNYVDKFSR